MLVAADGKRQGLEPCRHYLTFGIGCKTHIGFGRQSNEDAFWLAPDTIDHNQTRRLIVIADGMGGHKGGAFASWFACNALAGYYRKSPQNFGRPNPAQLCRDLTNLIFRIDRGLRFKACRTEDMQDMGTTLSCLILTASHSIIGHVGDSRIYRWREGHPG